MQAWRFTDSLVHSHQLAKGFAGRNGFGIVDWRALAAALADCGKSAWQLVQPQRVSSGGRNDSTHQDKFGRGLTGISQLL